MTSLDTTKVDEMDVSYVVCIETMSCLENIVLFFDYHHILIGFKHGTFVKPNNWDLTLDIFMITPNIKYKISPFEL